MTINHITVYSPSGRKFCLDEEHGALHYTILEPDGRKIPTGAIAPDEARDMMIFDLRREEEALALGINDGAKFC